MLEMATFWEIDHFETQGYKDTGTQRQRDTKTKGHKDTGIQRNRATKTQGHRDTKIKGHRDTGTQRHRHFRRFKGDQEDFIIR